MSKPSADTEAETIQQKSVYLRFVQRKKILYSARLIEFTVDSKYSSDHEPLSLEREIITRILFTTRITRIIIVIIHSLDCIDKSVQTYIFFLLFQSTDISSSPSIVKIREENLSGIAAFVNWQLTLYERAFSQLRFSSE